MSDILGPGQKNASIGVRRCKSLRSESSLSFVVVLICSVLVAFGSVRAVITPMGYWLAWASVVVAGVFIAGRKLWTLHESNRIRFISAGFGLLCLGLFVSACVNNDSYTLHQMVKFICIYLVFLVVNVSVRQLSAYFLLKTCRLVLLAVFVVFFACKYYFTEWFVQLGDGREGSHFAYPGVMWKTSVFFAGFLLASICIAGRRKNNVDVVLLFFAICLLLFDSSRTGFIWFAVICSGVLIKAGIYRKPKLLFLAVSVTAVLSVLLIGVFKWADVALFDRLFVMDNIRSKMLIDGVSNMGDCLPWGCGFGSSVSMVMEQPIVVHNAYLAATADLGLLGLAGLLIIVITPLYSYLLSRNNDSGCIKTESFKFVAMLGTAGYGFLMLLHPLSSELSEWGIWILMVSWQFSLSNGLVSSSADK